jgi:hypothetical protein
MRSSVVEWLTCEPCRERIAWEPLPQLYIALPKSKNWVQLSPDKALVSISCSKICTRVTDLYVVKKRISDLMWEAKKNREDGESL